MREWQLPWLSLRYNVAAYNAEGTQWKQLPYPNFTCSWRLWASG